MAACQRDHWCSTEEAFESVVEDAHAKAMTNQPRRHGVEYAPQNEAARGRHRDHLLLKVGCTPPWQVSELGALQLDPLAVVCVTPADNLVNERAIGIQVARAP